MNSRLNYQVMDTEMVKSYWAGQDRRKLSNVIKKASCVLGCPIDKVEVVIEMMKQDPPSEGLFVISDQFLHLNV